VCGRPLGPGWPWLGLSFAGGGCRFQAMARRRRTLLREFLTFLITEKKWWLIPLALLLLGLVGLLVLVEGSALAPFIYPLF
jgi:hypothetical protein